MAIPIGVYGSKNENVLNYEAKMAIVSQFFLFCHTMRDRSIPGTELGPSAVKVQNPDHWTAMEFPQTFL